MPKNQNDQRPTDHNGRTNQDPSKLDQGKDNRRNDARSEGVVKRGKKDGTQIRNEELMRVMYGAQSFGN